MFLERRQGWSVSVNVLVAIEVWLKYARGATVDFRGFIETFSKLIDPKYIQRSGRKVMFRMSEDEEYNLKDLKTIVWFESK